MDIIRTSFDGTERTDVIPVERPVVVNADISSKIKSRSAISGSSKVSVKVQTIIHKRASEMIIKAR